MSRSNKRTTLAARSAAVRRIFTGEYYEVIAAEFNVSLQAVNDWVRCWQNRIGSWYGKPLEAIEEQQGFTIEEWYQGPVLMGKRVVVPDAYHVTEISDAQVAVFVQFLGKPPLMDSRPFERAYKQMDAASQARFEPAFDAFQRAIEHASELRRYRALAMDLATRELAERAA